METIINFSVFFYTIFMVVFIEKIMYCKPLSINRIIDYQRELDESDRRAREKYGLEWSHDAFTEIMNQRKLGKGFTAIFSGMALVFVLVILACMMTLPLSSIGVICVSALMLMIYGIIRLSEKKWLAVGLLAFIFIIGTIMNAGLTKLMTMSPYSYFYLCGLIILIGVAAFIPQNRKKRK